MYFDKHDLENIRVYDVYILSKKRLNLTKIIQKRNINVIFLENLYEHNTGLAYISNYCELKFDPKTELCI